MIHSPWVEKYRPTSFEDIVLDPHNYIIMKNPWDYFDQKYIVLQKISSD